MQIKACSSKVFFLQILRTHEQVSKCSKAKSKTQESSFQKACREEVIQNNSKLKFLLLQLVSKDQNNDSCNLCSLFATDHTTPTSAREYIHAQIDNCLKYNWKGVNQSSFIPTVKSCQKEVYTRAPENCPESSKIIHTDMLVDLKDKNINCKFCSE